MVTIRKQKNAIKLSKPAGWWGSTWREALPTGNGVVGAAVNGGAGQDIIMLTHADLWWQGYVGVIPDVSDKLAQVRKSLDNSSYKEAEHVLSSALISKGYRPQVSFPLPICDLIVKTPIEKSVKEYSRTLNLENGEVCVSFKDGVIKYDRSLFVSRAHNNIVCYEITKSGSKTLEVDFSFEMHEKFNARTQTNISKLPDSVNIKYENFFMYYSAKSDNGTEFGCVAKITFYGGSQIVTQNGIKIKDADRIFVILKPFIESNREKEWKNIKAELSAIKLTYDKLIKEHTSLHSKIMGSCDLELDAANREQFADLLLNDFTLSGEMPLALLEKLWAFGRFLMVAGCTPNGKPLPPYALWCGDYKAVNSAITATSIVNQFSHALAGNLTDFYFNIFTYYESVIDDLKKNASRLFGCRGFFIPELMAHPTGLIGSTDSSVIHNISVGGIIANLFYLYYLHTDDVKFLKARALPFMKDVVFFYEEFLKIKGDSLYESAPSYSPYTTPVNFSNGGADTLEIAKNSTIDFAVVRELLINIIAASETCATNKPEIIKWKDMLTRIPNVYYNEDGTVREYCDSKLTDNISSPSTALFYGLFPGTSITNATPELTKALSVTAKKRSYASQQNATSVSLLRYASIFSRLNDGQNAYDTLCNTVKNTAMGNLVLASNDWRNMGQTADNIWATYTTEANSLITFAMQEMLLQSTSNSISILPGVPDAVVKGSVSGLLAKCACECDLSFDRKKGVYELKIKSKRTQKIDVFFPENVKKIKQLGSEKVDYSLRKIIDIELTGGKTVVLELK